MHEFRSDLKQEAINTVKEKVQPALVELQQFIAEVRHIFGGVVSRAKRFIR